MLSIDFDCQQNLTATGIIYIIRTLYTRGMNFNNQWPQQGGQSFPNQSFYPGIQPTDVMRGVDDGRMNPHFLHRDEEEKRRREAVLMEAQRIRAEEEHQRRMVEAERMRAEEEMRRRAMFAEEERRLQILAEEEHRRQMLAQDDLRFRLSNQKPLYNAALNDARHMGGGAAFNNDIFANILREKDGSQMSAPRQRFDNRDRGGGILAPWAGGPDHQDGWHRPHPQPQRKFEPNRSQLNSGASAQKKAFVKPTPPKPTTASSVPKKQTPEPQALKQSPTVTKVVPTVNAASKPVVKVKKIVVKKIVKKQPPTSAAESPAKSANVAEVGKKSPVEAKIPAALAPKKAEDVASTEIVESSHSSAVDNSELAVAAQPKARIVVKKGSRIIKTSKGLFTKKPPEDSAILPDFKYEDVKSTSLFKCNPCQRLLTSAGDFKKHVESADHDHMLARLEQVHAKAADFIRSYSALLEYRKVTGKSFKVSMRCEMCDLSVYGNIHKHRTSLMHLRLKNFIHPICEICDVKFERRIDWDKHKLTAKHLIEIEKAGKTKADPEYYSPMDFSSLLNINNDKKELKIEEEPAAKESKDVKDIYETERRQENALLAMDKIGDYEVPNFDESKMIGISFVKPVEGSFCRACKKFINIPQDSHCKTREHYDKFVDVVLDKKTRAFEIEVEKTSKRKATQELKPSSKVDEEDEEEEVEDDSGNWKRQRKAQDDYYVF